MANEENKKVVKNAVWLTVFQFANYIIPILIIPYITSKLGVENFGKVTFIQNIANYATILINFSFEYTSTKEIAIHKNDPAKVRHIFWNTIAIKSVLLFLTALVFIPYSISVAESQDEVTMYIAAWIINIGWCLYPSWYFQGIEKMSIMSITNFLIKFTGAILIILCVRGKDDSAIYLATYSIPYILGALGTLYYCIHNEGITLKSKDDLQDETSHSLEKSDEEGIIYLLRKSLPIFIANVFSSITPTLAMTIIGASAIDKLEIGYFSGAYKLIFAVLAVTNVPISMALFPKLTREYAQSKEAGIRYFRKSLKIVLLYSAAISVLTYLFAPLAVKILLANEFHDSITYLRAYSPAPFLCTTALFLTVQGLYAMDRQNIAFIISIITLVFCFSITHILIKTIGGEGAAYAYLVAEALEIIISGSIVHYYNNKVLAVSSDKLKES